MRVIRRISAVIIGFVLFLSGVLKLMDPVGATLVMEEYFKFLHLGGLSALSGVAGVGMALLEALLGAALITGVWRKIAGVATGILLGIFTLLTVLLYIRNPKMDCGCFGEVIHLTHLQSLLKNVALMVLWALAFLPLRKQERTRKIKFVSFPIAAVSVCVFMIWSLMRIPLVDFTPFKPGAELMLPEDIDDPTDDRTPTLSLSDASGEYVDELLMNGDLMAVSVYDPESMKPHQWAEVARLSRDASETGYRPLVLAAATPAMMEELVPAGTDLSGITYFADRKKLLTLNRSNGGATYLQDGLIVNKWGFRQLPDRSKLEEFDSADVTESLLSENNGARVKFQAFLLYVFAVLLVL